MSSISSSAAPRQLPTRGRVLVRAAAVYDIGAPMMMFWQEARMHRRMADALQPREGERFLDIGCGTGALTAEIARRMTRGEVVGVDASLAMIAVARRKRGGGLVHFEPALAEQLPFEDASFDAVASSMFFHHVPLDLKRRSAAEILRVLKPGGRVVVADIDRPRNAFGWLYGGGGWLLFRQPETKENLDGVLPQVLRDAGLSDLKLFYMTLGCISAWVGRKP